MPDSSNRGQRTRQRLPSSASLQKQRFFRPTSMSSSFIVNESEDGSGVDLFPSKYRGFFNNNENNEEESESSTIEGETTIRGNMNPSHDTVNDANASPDDHQLYHQQERRPHLKDQASGSGTSSVAGEEVSTGDNNNNNNNNHQENHNNNDPDVDQGLTEEQIRINKEIVIPLFESILSQADSTTNPLRVFIPSSSSSSSLSSSQASSSSSSNNNHQHHPRHPTQLQYQQQHRLNQDYHLLPSSSSSSSISSSFSSSLSSPFFASHAIRSVTL